MQESGAKNIRVNKADAESLPSARACTDDDERPATTNETDAEGFRVPPEILRKHVALADYCPGQS